LATPTDAVTSVNGNTGVVTVTENVTTNLSITGTDAARTIVSSDGTDAVIPVATDSVSGVMSAADHTKLTGIETSADVTDTANVTAAGALMDSELVSIADVKALDQSVISGASPTFGTANMSDATNKRFMTDAQETKLDSVESSADVTDTANVTAAGALMDSELTDLAGVKGVTISTLQVKPSEGAFANGDKTKLDGIEASADVTDTANVTAAGALMDSELTDLAGVKGVTISTLQVKPSEGAFVDGDKTKLDAIEASADVTDTANVTAAGALMDSELTDLAGVKGVTISTLQPKPSEGAFANGDKTKLDGIEASADVTDTANVTSAGALMDSELTSIADVKALDQSVVSGASPNFATTNMTDASNKRFMSDAQESKLDGIEASATADQTAAEILTAIKTVDGASSGLDADLLDGVEGSSYLRSDADDTFTGTLNVAGTVEFDGLSGTGAVTVTDILDEDDMSTNSATMLATQQSIKAYVDANAGSMSDAAVRAAVEAATDSNVFTDADHSKLNGIEASATADQTAAQILTAIKTVDGSGSGLDADLLDGVQGASYLRSDADDAVNAYTTQITFPSNTTGATASGDQSSLQVKQATANSDAFMTFHVEGDFATYFGIDGTTNDLFVGGWSMGANKYKIWHQNNDGSGSGLDADTLDGVQGASYLRSDANDTYTGDLTVTGTIALSSHLDMPDDANIKLGTGDDLQLYHDGSNSYITEGGTGVLFLRSNQLQIQSDDGLETYATFTDNGAVTLYHNNAAKLATTSSGIDVTGTGEFDAMIVQSAGGYGNIEIGGPSGAYIDLKKPHSDDYDFRIMYDGTAALKTTDNYVSVSTASGYVHIGPQNTSYSHFSTDRAKFYFNKQINVDSGIIASHNEDMQLLPGASTQSAYIKLVNGASTTNGTYHYFVDDNADQSTYAHTMNSNQSGSQTTTADRLHTNLFVDTNVTATGGGTDHEHRPIGIYNDMDITGSNTDPDLIWGLYNYVTLSQTGTGTTGAAYGDYNQVYLNHESSSQSVGNATGTFSRVYHANAAGTSTNSYAAYNVNYYHSSANADTSASYGTYSEVEANRDITYPNFIVNLAIIDRNDGTISNGYMYKADYQGTLPTNAWGVYCEGDKHYLQGRVGINTTSPSSDYALDVNGDIVCDKIRIEGNGDASLSSTHMDYKLVQQWRKYSG